MESLFSLFSSQTPMSLMSHHHQIPPSPPKFSFETCMLMLNKVKREREEGLYDAGGDIFKGLMLEFEKNIEAFVGSYMILLTIYTYQLGQESFFAE
jgi:hypothetical protein